jgi:hypothetical protein
LMPCFGSTSAVAAWGDLGPSGAGRVDAGPHRPHHGLGVLRKRVEAMAVHVLDDRLHHRSQPRRASLYPATVHLRWAVTASSTTPGPRQTRVRHAARALGITRPCRGEPSRTKLVPVPCAPTRTVRSPTP